MATYLVKNGTTYETVRDLQAAVTLNSGDIVQLDDSAGAITETYAFLGLRPGVTYTSLSSRSVWSVHSIGLHNNTVVRNLRFPMVYNGLLFQPYTNDGVKYVDAIIDRNYVEARRSLANLSEYSNYNTDGWTFSNNIFNLSSSVHFDTGIDFRPAGLPRYLYIYNNVFVSNFTETTIMCIFTNPSINIKNNIFYGNGIGYGIYLNNTDPNPNVDYNCAYNYTTNRAIYIASGGSYGANNLIEIDPKFVNPASDFHFQAGSPCLSGGINHSNDSKVPLYDYDNRPRRDLDRAMGVYSRKPLSFFDSTSVTDGTPVNSYLSLSELVGMIQYIGTDSYFDSENKIGKTVVYYNHESGREQKRLYFDQDHTSSVAWSSLARDGTWQKTMIKVYDREGAISIIPRSYIDSTGEDIIHSGGQAILNESY